MIHAALERVTVVVPVGPGDNLSARLRAQLAALPSQAQVCVVSSEAGHAAPVGDASVDASSSEVSSNDASLREAAPHEGVGPRWQQLVAPRGRALQQNAGAAAATRDWLWFVHADAALAPDTLPALARFIAADVDALGYFDLRFLDDGPAAMRVNALGAQLRSRWFGLPFGDQGLVLPRHAFASLGGFNPGLASGEDHDLVWRARRAGLPLQAVGAPLYTSARKYAQQGWCATTFGHLRETWRQARRFSRMPAPR